LLINIDNETKTAQFSYTVEDGFNFFGETYSTTLTASGNVSGNSTKTLTFETLGFCSLENTFDEEDSNKLRVTIDDIRVVKGLGEDGDGLPFDQVEIDVNVENSLKDDINDIVLEWGLFDKNSGKWIIELTEEKEFDLNDKDDITKTISFSLNEKDLNIDLSELTNADLVFYARATGVVDADEEYTVCHSDETSSSDLELHIDKDFAIATEFKVLGTANCGSQIEVSGKVWNIGKRDQDDISLNVYNKELNINEKLDIGDIDSFSSKKFSVLITIPDDAQAKKYTLSFSVYDEDGDLFESSYEDLESIIYLDLDVQGNCASATIPKASVSAKLQSDAVPGQDLLVKFVVSNLNTKTTTFDLELSGYQLWASSAELDKNSLTLESGQSAEVLATLKVNEDASGIQNFNLLVKEGTKVLTQQVSVNLGEKESSSTNSIFNNLFEKLKNKNAYVWIIGILNLVLVALIIIVSVKLAKKK
jgi:hypothetical protein